ncbi:MAG: cation-translocating P-type ATPase, partial [Bacteroidota bacterium]
VLTAALLTARWVQLRSQRLAGDATDRLLALLPTMVRRVLNDGTLETVRADELEPGDLVEIPAGDIVPVDGVVDTGRSALDNAVLTGESRPIVVHPGHTVEAGGTNLRAPLRVRVQAAGESTRIGALLRWVREAQDQHAPVTLLADRFGGWFVAAVLGLSVISLGVSLALAPDETVSRLVALLVITCPCALSMATPLAMAVHSGRAARRGLFIKSSAAIQALTNVDTIVLDKTGTVTEGRMSLAVTHGDPDALRLAARLEAHSDHPVAVAFVQQFSVNAGKSTAMPTVKATSDTIVHEAVAGAGLRGWIDDQLVVVGRPDWVAEHASMPAEWAGPIGNITAEALTPVAIAVDGAVRAVAGVGDRIRSGSTEIIRSLRDGGFSVHLLSGDHPSVVDAVARPLGIRADHAVGRATPEDKRVYIERLRAAGQRVCVAGDGVNDAGALQAADVGLAVHGGRTASLVAADAFLTVPGLSPLADALRSAAGTMRLIRHLLVFSAGYNVLGAAAAVAGLVTPLVAAVAMPISSLVVVAGAVYQAGRLPRTQQRMKPDRLHPDSPAQPPTNAPTQPT